jgi:hypothetical protein
MLLCCWAGMMRTHAAGKVAPSEDIDSGPLFHFLKAK